MAADWTFFIRLVRADYHFLRVSIISHRLFEFVQSGGGRLTLKLELIGREMRIKTYGDPDASIDNRLMRLSRRKTKAFSRKRANRITR